MRRLRKAILWLGPKRLMVCVPLGIATSFIAAWLMALHPKFVPELNDGYRVIWYLPLPDDPDQLRMWYDRYTVRSSGRVLPPGIDGGGPFTMPELGSHRLSSFPSWLLDSDWLQRRGLDPEATVYFFESTGWPLRQLIMFDVSDLTTPQAPIHYYHKWVYTPAVFDHLFRRDRIPFGVIPAGAIVNSLIYAVLWYPILTMGVVVRNHRRVRRGLCVRCCYDLAGLERCPECGHAAKVS